MPREQETPTLQHQVGSLGAPPRPLSSALGEIMLDATAWCIG